MKVPLAPSGLRAKDIDAVQKVLQSGNVTMGERVAHFESDMARYLNVKHFVMMNSGSSANLAILEALIRPTKSNPLLQKDDEVLVPAIAWPTTIWPLIQLGLKPRFVDINPLTLELDLSYAYSLIQSSKGRIRALFPIHPLGFGIDNGDLRDFARQHDLVLINDVCESLGSWQDSEHSGIVGEASSFSFYFSHHMTTMEGGGVATNNYETYNDLKSIRSHGWSRDRSDFADWNFEIHPSMQKFNFVSTGYNIRPMEIQAAVGLQQLADLEQFVFSRRKNVQYVSDAIHSTQLQLLGTQDYGAIQSNRQHSWMHIPLRIQSHKPKEARLRAVRFLEDSGIETRPPLTGNFLKQPAMARYLENQATGDFMNTDSISDSTFLIGCHHDLSETQIDYVTEKLKYLAKNVL
jgi:CDP-6-deoxy-D-xylo-4-hexulose-3-dehydrase